MSRTWESRQGTDTLGHRAGKRARPHVDDDLDDERIPVRIRFDHVVTRGVGVPKNKTQSPAKVLGFRHLMAGSTGLEPAASGVTGRRSNQLNYDPTKRADRSLGGTGFEPVTAGV